MPEGMAGDGMDAGHGESTPVAEGARSIEVNTTSFAFDPAEITVSVGEDISIVLSSDDLLHDFTIDEIDVHIAAENDETAEGGLRARATAPSSPLPPTPHHPPSKELNRHAHPHDARVCHR